MDELEKSIEYFERAHETMAKHGHTAPLEEINALAALYEKKKRQNGCEHCRGWDNRCGANYCPMCGRDLRKVDAE